MMKNSPVSYPTDYENDSERLREHRRGVALVWILISLIVVAATISGALTLRAVLTPANAERIEAIVDSLSPKNSQGPLIVVPDVTAEPTPGVQTIPFVPETEPEAPTVTAAPIPTAEPNPDFEQNAAQPYDEPFESLPDVIEAVMPGVVDVQNWQTYARNGKLVEASSGSGFIITTDGYILTNAHVIEDAEKIVVALQDGTEYVAALVGADRTTDTAALKIDAEGLTALPKGDSDAIRVGETVFAIGNPVRKELNGSVTLGIVSAKDRTITIDGYSNTYIQTDAAINFGSSGGPLLNDKGYVIGMAGAKTVTAGYDDYGNRVSAEGLGYALPINRVWEIASQLISTGKVQKPGIGITITQAQEMYAAPGDETRPYIAAVNEGGPADKAGLKAYDVILALDGTPFDDYSDIVNFIREKTKVGQTVIFTIERDGEQMDVPVVIGDLNQ